MVKRNKCPCCGNYTLIGDSEDIAWDICPVCFWENDVFDDNPDSYSGANRMTLKQGRSNYKTFSACDESMIKNVRPPKKNELPENNEKTVYEFNFWYEWGTGDACLWNHKKYPDGKFNIGMVSLDSLNLSENLKQTIVELGEEYQSSLDWNYPPDPSPWSQEHKDDFLKRTKIVYKKLCDELGDKFKINYCVDVPD